MAPFVCQLLRRLVNFSEEDANSKRRSLKWFRSDLDYIKINQIRTLSLKSPSSDFWNLPLFDSRKEFVSHLDKKREECVINLCEKTVPRQIKLKLIFGTWVKWKETKADNVSSKIQHFVMVSDDKFLQKSLKLNFLKWNNPPALL